jgi:hypothetical protein
MVVFSSRAQGSLEYLLIIGAGLLVVAIVIVSLTGILGGTKSMGSDSNASLVSSLGDLNALRGGSSSAGQPEQTLLVSGMNIPVSNSLTTGVVLSINDSVDFADKSSSNLTVTKHAEFCSSCLEVAHADPINFSGDFSFSVLVKPISLDEYYKVVLFKSSPVYWDVGFGFANHVDIPPEINNQMNFFVNRYWDTEFNVFSWIPDSEFSSWTHFVGVYSYPNLKLYKNGVLEESQLLSDSLTQNSQSLFIGYEPSFIESSFDGEIKGVTFWSRALSDPEITDLSSRVQSAFGN